MRQIKILADERSAEALSDMLMDAGALSATIEDADAESTDEKPLYGEPGLEPDNCAWPRSIVSILADDDFDLETSLAIAVKALKCEKPELLGTEEVEDADWVRITQAQFQPTQVSDRLWIVPTWHDLPNEDAINVRLDPGVAFGTGSIRPPTSACSGLTPTSRRRTVSSTTAAARASSPLPPNSSARPRSPGTDIDPQAVEAAGDNALMNHVEAKFYLPDDMPEGTYDIVVANILANPLKLLAPALLGRVKQGGALVLSGVLAKQAEEVIAAYQAIDPAVKLSVWRQEEDWVCIAGRRA